MASYFETSLGLTLSVYRDHTSFLNESNSPFFLIVCSRLSMEERWMALSGRSDVLIFFRCGRIGSSAGCLLAAAISVAIVLQDARH